MRNWFKSLRSSNSFMLGVALLVILAVTMFAANLGFNRMTSISQDISESSSLYTKKIAATEHLLENIQSRGLLLQALVTQAPGSAAHIETLSKYQQLRQTDLDLLNHTLGDKNLSMREINLLEQAHADLITIDRDVANILNVHDAASDVGSHINNFIAPDQGAVHDSMVALLLYYNETLNVAVIGSSKKIGAVQSTHKPVLVGLFLIGALVSALVLLRSARFGARMAVDRKQLRRRVQQQVTEINEQKEQLMVTFESIADAVITTDVLGSVKYINPAAELLTGWSIDEAVGKRLAEVMNLENDDRLGSVDETGEWNLYALGKKLHRQKSLIKRRDGEERHVEESIAEISDESGDLTGYVVVIRDISKRLQMQKELSIQATRDELTKLTNRPEFKRQLEKLLESVNEAPQDHHLLCFVDLDRFKVVNDTAGHTAGDEILRQVAQLMASMVRKHDALARLGGDEFAFLLRNCELGNGIRVMKNIVHKIEQTRFIFGDEQFSLGASVGMVELGPESDAESALTHADTACYLAKDSGGNTVQVYHSDSKEMSMQRGQVKWLSRVQMALNDNDFELFYQPIERIVRNTNGFLSVEHYEVLVRMHDHDGGYFMPGDFIPAATRYGLMPRLDRWVVDNALGWCGQNRELLTDKRLAINIDGSSLCDEQFLEFVKNCFYDYEVDYSSIIFELTENSIVANMNAAMKFINTFKEKGCQFSLDDFGTGVSSFDYLKSLPVDYLKIDGSFVKDMLRDEIDEEVVRSINAIAKAMNKHTIAEYVESDAIREKLAHIGVNFVQGYAIARPKPLSDFIKENYRAPASAIRIA